MSNGNSNNISAMRDERTQTSRSAATSQGPQGPQLGAQEPNELLKQCREMALDRLSKSLTKMLDKVQDTLWGMAEATTDRDTRDIYLQARDKAQAQRQIIEERFKKEFQTQFEQRAKKQTTKDEPEDPLEESSLSLVDDDALHESLKVKDLTSKMRGLCDEELRALDQRIGFLLKDPNLKNEENPLSPDAVYSAFKQACDEIEAGLKVKMVILNLFDQQVQQEMQGIYKDINSLLVKNAVLPKIRFGFRRPIVGGGAMAAASALAAAQGGTPGASAGGGDYGASAGDAVMGTEQDFYALLQGLLSRQYAGGTPGMPLTGPAASMTTFSGGVPGFGAGLPGGSFGTATGPVRILSGHDLLGALTQIQQGDASIIQGATNSLAAAIAAPSGVNILRDIKTTKFGKGMGEVDSMTLDIVAMLFDHILEDKKIPDAMKALIGRLQIPILKVAILDKTFFQKKSHPARRMLNTLGVFGLGLGPDFQVSNPLFKQVEAILQKLIDKFEDDLALFEKTEADLEQVIEAENRRAEEEAQRAARLIEYREKLQIGRAMAQQEVKKRVETGQMPQAVLKFLAEEWIKLLVMAHAKVGPDSDAWKSAVQTMDHLIWSVALKQNAEERRRLATLLPVLLKRLQRGMQLIGTQDEVRTKFLSKLMRCHTKVISGAPEAPRKTAKPAVKPQRPTAPDQAPASTPGQTTNVPTLSDIVEVPTNAASGPTTSAFSTRRSPDSSATGAQPAAKSSDAVGRNGHLADLPLPPEFGSASEGSSVHNEVSLPSEFEEVTGSKPPPVETDEDTRLSETLPSFKSMIIKNPFGDGEIEVEEISLDNLPAFGPNDGGRGDTLGARTGDEYSLRAGSMSVGTWIELRTDEDAKVQARLSWISPLKGTYLFTNRHGAKVAEFSLYQLSKEMRQGNCTVMEEVPLFDRAMSNLVGVLRKGSEATV